MRSASKKLDKHKSCIRKQVYRSLEDAISAAQHRNDQIMFKTLELIPYQCRYGQHWHIGHVESGAS